MPKTLFAKEVASTALFRASFLRRGGKTGAGVIFVDFREENAPLRDSAKGRVDISPSHALRRLISGTPAGVRIFLSCFPVVSLTKPRSTTG